jgi:two-component system cell cycle response regulator
MARRSARTPTNHTVLVVDDQEETLDSVRGLLEREGHQVLTASSGAEALDVLRSHDVHLIILDYFMPRMTGADLVREIRKFDQGVQIILQTGYAGEKPPRVMLSELEIQGYHNKADEPERLLLWVDVSLKTYRLLRTMRERETLQEELVANCSH